jgi:hypothetical protein
VTLNSSTVSGNTAEQGGGVYGYGGTLTLNYSAVTRNTATVDGGGIYNNGGALTLNSSFVIANTPDNIAT